MRKSDAQYQSNYRAKIEQQGLVRCEIQIRKEDKALFEKLASATTKSSATNQKRNIKKAKANLFHELLCSKANEYKKFKQKLDHNEAILNSLLSNIPPIDKSNLFKIPKTIQELTSDTKAQQVINDLQVQNFKLKQEIIKMQYWLDRYKDICEVYEKESAKTKG